MPLASEDYRRSLGLLGVLIIGLSLLSLWLYSTGRKTLTLSPSRTPARLVEDRAFNLLAPESPQPPAVRVPAISPNSSAIDSQPTLASFVQPYKENTYPGKNLATWINRFPNLVHRSPELPLTRVDTPEIFPGLALSIPAGWQGETQTQNRTNPATYTLTLRKDTATLVWRLYPRINLKGCSAPAPELVNLVRIYPQNNLYELNYGGTRGTSHLGYSLECVGLGTFVDTLPSNLPSADYPEYATRFEQDEVVAYTLALQFYLNEEERPMSSFSPELQEEIREILSSLRL